MPATLLINLDEALTKPIYEQQTRLHANELAILKASLPIQSYKAMDPIFEFNHQADEIYFVLSGRVLTYEKMSDTRFMAFDLIQTGGFCGEVGTLYDGYRSASAVALEPTELLVLKMTAFDAFLKQHPSIMRLLMKGMAERLSRSGKDLRGARLRDPDAIARETPSALDRFTLGSARFLGSWHFLVVFGIAMAVWGALYRWRGLDPNTIWIALTLSVTQIVIGNLVLNSQRRAGELEAKIDALVKEAVFKADQTITTVRTEQETLKTEIREEIKAHLHAIGKPPF